MSTFVSTFVFQMEGNVTSAVTLASITRVTMYVGKVGSGAVDQGLNPSVKYASILVIAIKSFHFQSPNRI